MYCTRIFDRLVQVQFNKKASMFHRALSLNASDEPGPGQHEMRYRPSQFAAVPAPQCWYKSRSALSATLYRRKKLSKRVLALLGPVLGDNASLIKYIRVINDVIGVCCGNDAGGFCEGIFGEKCHKDRKKCCF